MQMSRALTHTLLVALLATAPACSQPRAERCTLNVIAGLGATVDGALLAELGAAIDASVTLVRPMAAGLYLLALEADGPPSACEAALERLRRDTRVSSADRDDARQIHPH